MTFFEGGPEALPRFVSLSLTDKLFLIFLDDSRIYSGRAEELTLFTLGRLSASIAHEMIEAAIPADGGRLVQPEP